MIRRVCRNAIPAALLFLAAAGCGRADAPAMPPRPPSPVVTEPAVAKDVPVYLDEVGICVGSESVVVVPQVTGRITQVSVHDGTDLKIGDALFTVDPRPYVARHEEAKAKQAAATAAADEARAAQKTASARLVTATSKRDETRARAQSADAMVDAARGDAASAEADAQKARSDAKRMEAMSESGAVSQQDLIRARADAAAAEARADAAKRRAAAITAQRAESGAAEASADSAIREAESQLVEADAKVVSAVAQEAQAKAAVEPARLDVEYCSIASPIAGRAGRHMADVGSIVKANETPLLSIQRTDPIEVELFVTENDLSAVQRSLAAKAIAAEVRLGSEAESRHGDVVFVDNAVSTSTGTARLRVRLANADAKFWPGRFVRVRVLLDTLVGAVLVEARAVQSSPVGPFVYVVKKAEQGFDTGEMRPVRLGQRQGDLVVVLDGVKVGERIVVEGQIGVFPGAPVAEAPKPSGQNRPAGPEAPESGMDAVK